MCDCFHIAFPNWHAASSGAGAGRRLRGPEPGTEDNSICDEASQFTEGERPRPQGSSPVEEFPESDRYGDSDKECEAEHDSYRKGGKKPKKSGLGSIFDKRSTPKMSKLKEAPSPEAGVIVKTAKDGGAEGLVYSGGGKDGIFIKEVVPESPASKNLHLKEGDQVLSATVYFDNIPYEDAIQILEHAQAYKVKLCLKRKPEITETEEAIDSDAIPEDEVHQPQMRDSGKKRRGEARISWPKFPTLGRGKKSRFTRSHSSSEADEQRKLELSPTTSDTESPIKSQDALKGKKKHKIKLPGLKRGRISSSEDTDAQNIQTEEMISPQCLHSPSRETQDTEEEMKKGDNAKVEESETKSHKTELVCLDSTLKTTDITLALVEEDIPSATASPDGKKKKKERSELKLKILGRDKKHKAKSSPKRLKTLGASLDKTEMENENTEAVTSGATENVMDSEVPKMSSSKSSQMELRLPKVEIDISDVGIICKSNDKKGKDTEEKKAKTGFKLPKVGLSKVANEEIIKIDASVEGRKTKDNDDAYDRLLKSAELPKREDIEIPGMEDVSKITKDFKEPRAPLAALSEAELTAETVQMSIDVDSVKEAVSKLPGYKLPKVDISGVPIPDEFTVIDANAQRISVKTPTKGKNESKAVLAELSKTTIKLPNVNSDVSGGEIMSETKVVVKKFELDSKDGISKAIISQTVEVEQVQKDNMTFSNESSKELDMKIKTPKVASPDLSMSKPDIKISDFKMDLTKIKDDKVQVERTIFLPGDKSDVKDSAVKISPIKAEFEIPKKEIDQKLKLENEEKKVTSVKCEVSVGELGIKTPEKQEKHGKFKMPTVGISVPKVKAGTIPDVDVDRTMHMSAAEVEVEKPKLEFKSQQTDTGKEANLKSNNVTLPEEKNLNVPKLADVEITGDLEAQGGKFKLPKLGIKMPKMKAPELDVRISNNVDVTQPDVKAKEEIPEVPIADLTIGATEVSILDQKANVKAPSIEAEAEGGKFKMPKLGVKLPKVKGPEHDISLSKKDRDVVLPKVEESKTGEVADEIDRRGGKFKMPKLGITMPKMKEPESDIDLSKTDVESILPEVKADINVPDGKLKDISTPRIDDVKIKTDAEIDHADHSLSLKVTAGETDAKAGTFKMPKFGISMPKLKGPEIDFNLSMEEKDVKPTEVKVPKVDITAVPKDKIQMEKTSAEIKPFEAKLDIKKPEVKSQEAKTDEGQSGKFKIPRFTIAIPNVKAPQIDSSLEKAIEVALPEAKIEVEHPKAQKMDVQIKSPEMEGDIEGQGEKFKQTKFGIKMPKVKGPDIDISLPKKQVKSPEMKVDLKVPKVDASLEKVDVKITETRIEAEKPNITDVEVKPSLGKIKIKAPDIDVSVTEDSSSKFKMPSLGFSVPKMKAPEVESSFSIKDTSLTMPDAKVEVVVPKISEKADMKAPEVEVSTRSSPLKFKMPVFKLPKFGGSIEEKDSEIKSEGTEVPQLEFDRPDVNAEVQLPQLEVIAPPCEVVAEQPLSVEMDAKFKKPRFSLPRFSFSKQSGSAPEIDIRTQEVNFPEGKIEVKREIDVKTPEFDVQIDGQEVKSPSKRKMPTFKLPKIGGSIPEASVTVSEPQLDIDLPDVKKESRIPDVEVKVPTGEVVIEQPPSLEIDAKLKKPRFSLPRFSFSKQNVPSSEVDISAPEVNITLPEGKVQVEEEIDVKAPELEAQVDGKGSKFKLPKFGISMPQMSAPELDLTISKKDGELALPKAEVEGKVPDIEVNIPSIQAEIQAPEIKVETKSNEGSPAKLKMPTFKFPKFGASIPDAEIKVDGPNVSKVDVGIPEVTTKINLPEVEVKDPSVEVEIEQPSGLEIDAKFKKPKFSMPRFSFSKQSVPPPEVDISAPELNIPQQEGKVQVEGEIDVKAPELEAQIDGQGSKFKLPKFGISMPKITAPEIDLSLSKKGGEMTLPEAEVEGKLLDVEVKGPLIEAEIQGHEIKLQTKTKEGSPSKVKMPTFKFPKFGTSIPEAEIKVDDPNVTKVNVDLPEVKTKINLPEVEVKAPSVEVEIEQQSGLDMEAKFKKPRFSMPRFSFSKQNVPAPEVDFSAPEVNIPQPEEKMEVGGEIDAKAPELDVQIEGQRNKFKLPKFGISMPQISAPEIDLSLSKRDGELTIPEGKVEAPSFQAEIQAPEINIETKTKEGSPSKLKMPSFKFPKFGASIPEAEIKIDGSNVTQMDVDQPEVKTNINIPEVEVKAPSVEVEIEQPSELEMDAKFKKPRFSMPRFSFSKQSVPAPDIDCSAPEVNIPQPEVKVEVGGEIDVKNPEIKAQIDGHGSKFKLPKFGISVPKISAPEIDLSLSKRDVEVTLPEAKIEGKLPDVDAKAPSLEAEIKAPKVETKSKEGSPSKLKMPTFKLPKFGASIAEAEIKVEGIDFRQVDVDLPEVKAEVHLPEVEVNAPSVEMDIEPSGVEMDAKFKKPRFSLPRFSFSKQSGPAPEVDIIAPEANIPQPEVKVKGDIDLNTPELEGQIDGQGSKFKLPSFGISMPKMSAAKVTLPEEKVETKVPDVEVKAPSIEVEVNAPELKVETKIKEGSPSKLRMPTFKLPKFGVSIPEAEIHVDRPHITTEVPQVDADLHDAEREVHIAAAELKVSSGEVMIEQPSTLEIDAKIKKPRFSLPKFSFSKQSSQTTEVDVSAPEVEIPQTEGKEEIKGEVEIKSPEPDVQIDPQGIKFKLPKFGISMPKISAPEIDLSVSKKHVETISDAKLEVEDKACSIGREIKAPELKVETKTKEGSPSRLKMPTFKLPIFGVSIPETEIKVDSTMVDADIPYVKGEINLPKTEVEAPSGEVVMEQPSGLELDANFKKSRFSLPKFSFSKQSVPAPEVDINAPEANTPVEGNIELKAGIDIKSPEVEAQVDGQGSKFKFPKFGISMPKISPAEIDPTVSEMKVECQLPGVEQKGTFVEAEIKSPEIKVESKQIDFSPSKLKMPSFRMPMFGLMTSSVSADGADIKTDIHEEILTVQTDRSSVDVKVSELEVKRSKFKLPGLGFSTTGTQVAHEKKSIQLPDVEIPDTTAKEDMKVSEKEENKEQVSPSKFKMPSFKLPKFGATAEIDGETLHVDTGINIDVNVSKTDVESEKPEAKEESKTSWSLPRISFSKPSIAVSEIDDSASGSKKEVLSPDGKKSVDIAMEGQPAPEIDVKIKKSRFSLPKMSFAKQPSIESDTSIPEADLSSPGVTVKVKKPEVDQKIEGEVDAQESKFKLPKFGLSTPKVKGPEADVSVLKKEVKADVSETKYPIKVEESPTKFRMPTLKLPKIGLSLEASNGDKNLKNDGPEGEITAITPTDSAESKEVKKEPAGSKFNFGIFMPKAKGPEIDLTLSKDTDINSPDTIVVSTPPEEEANELSLDAKQKGASWSFPQFSFSKPTVNVSHESDANVKSDSKVFTPDFEAKGPSVAVENSPTAEPEIKAKFSLPKFSFSKTPTKEPIISDNTVALEVSLLEGEVKIREPKDLEVKTPENDTKSKDTEGSPLKFKMPIFKMPKLGITATVSEESSNTSKDIEETIKITEEGGVVIIKESPVMEVKTEDSIKRPSLEIKTDVTKASTPDPETPPAETQSSPSKFRLPSFKMPKLSFSKSMPDDENTRVDDQLDNDQQESFSKEESKSPKKSLASIGEVLKNIDVEFDVPSPLEENIESPQKNSEAQKQQEAIKNETKQEATKSPERTGWFKFPTFGLSSPTDTAKSNIKEDRKSTVDLTDDDELSTTCSLQSSDAFGDISSTITSENVGFSLSSPTKVRVKYSDPDSAALIGKSHSNVVMSTTKTEVISVQPNLPEKITISGHSSSSEDTVKLESGKIHIISSNIQATPDSQQAKMLTSIRVQSAEGVLGHGSWTVADSQSSKSTVMESRVVRESTSKEVVITKQITRVVKTAEPISDATATSIKQLKDSVHTDKMRFFDEADK